MLTCELNATNGLHQLEVLDEYVHAELQNSVQTRRVGNCWDITNYTDKWEHLELELSLPI